RHADIGSSINVSRFMGESDAKDYLRINPSYPTRLRALSSRVLHPARSEPSRNRPRPSCWAWEPAGLTCFARYRVRWAQQSTHRYQGHPNVFLVMKEAESTVTTGPRRNDNASGSTPEASAAIE